MFTLCCVSAEETFSYGNGIVILFCGGSGTGKTMTVNAVAKKLDKRVLLVNFDVMQSEKTGQCSCELQKRLNIS